MFIIEGELFSAPCKSATSRSSAGAYGLWTCSSRARPCQAMTPIASHGHLASTQRESPAFAQNTCVAYVAHLLPFALLPRRAAPRPTSADVAGSRRCALFRGAWEAFRSSKGWPQAVWTSRLARAGRQPAADFAGTQISSLGCLSEVASKHC